MWPEGVTCKQEYILTYRDQYGRWAQIWDKKTEWRVIYPYRKARTKFRNMADAEAAVFKYLTSPINESDIHFCKLKGK